MRSSAERVPAITTAPRMPSETTDFVEQGRRVFAGDWQFIAAAGSLDVLPPMAGMEVAFAGRSNVGKSSLINALTGRNALARTSHTPGRTQELIFFQGPPLSGLRLVDMPGYGYASAPKSKIAAWTDLIHRYLQGRANLGRVYVLIDSRHGLKDVDLDVLKTFDRAAVILPDRADQGGPGENGGARPAHRRHDGRAQAASGGVSRCHRHVIEDRRRHGRIAGGHDEASGRAGVRPRFHRHGRA